MKRNDSDSKYLQQLRYDSGLEKKFFYKYITNIRFVILLILSILILGIYSYKELSRRFMPEIKIPIVIVTTVLPGAGPEDVETLLTNSLEKEILSIDGIESVSSTSKENLSIIKVQFESKFDPDKAVTDVQQAVDSVNNLPDDALDSKVMRIDFEDVPIWTFALLTDKDDASLMTLVSNLSDEIENLPKVDRVELNGEEVLEVQIVVDLEKLQQYNLNPAQLASLIDSQLKSYPAGSVETGRNSFSVTLDSTIVSVDDIRNMVLDLGATQRVVDPANSIEVAESPMPSTPAQVVLSDVADVVEAPKDQITATYVIGENGEASRAVSFSVYKRINQPVEDTYYDIKEVVDSTLAEYDGSFTVADIDNSANLIADQFDTLSSNFIMTLLLVFIVLVVFLGIRQASVASFSIPLTFLIAFAVMKFAGLSLNFLTMFSLLLALGLVVDDAIVIVSAMTRYHRTGKFDERQTGALVWRDFIVPIWTTTLTTVWAFLPLLLSTGVIGSFIKSIPIVVSTTLLASTSVAVLVTLPLMIIFLKPRLPDRVKLFAYSSIILFIGILLGIFVGKSIMLPFVLLVYILLVAVFRLFIKKDTNFNRENSRVNSGDSGSSDMNSKANSKDDKNINANSNDYGSSDIVTVLRNFTNRLEKNKYLGWISHKISVGFIDLGGISQYYKVFIEKILNNKKSWVTVLVVVLGFSLFSYLLVPMGFVENELFPKKDEDVVYVQLTMPSGTKLDITRESAFKVANELRSMPEYKKVGKYMVVEVGKVFAESMLSVGGGSSNEALISVKLVDSDMRGETSFEIAETFRGKLADFSAGDIAVKEISGGPPVGADLEIRVLGDDLDKVNSYADKLVNYMNMMQGVYDAEKSAKSSLGKITFVPNEAKLRELGLTNKEVGFWLRTFASGFNLGTIDTVYIDDEDIVLKTSTDVQTPEDIDRIYIPTKSGYMPISSLGVITLKENPFDITHEDGERVVYVTASVADGYSAPTLNKQVEKYASTELGLEKGYTWKTGGANEENKKSVKSIIEAMIISAILIIITMVIQLGSFRKSFIVFMVIPLAISGVFVIFALTGTPLSFPALIGLLALFGIVVNNSIMLVEKIKQNEFAGMKLKEAISDASASRLEPIALSSLTTLMGLIPITISDPVWRGLGGAIISGLLFSGTVMLLFIPVLYYVIYKDEKDTKIF